jgi:hypothetical protein
MHDFGHEYEKKMDVLLGAFSMYSFDRISAWIKSIKATSFAGDIVVCVGQTTNETLHELHVHGVQVIPLVHAHAPIHVARFFTFYDFLSRNAGVYKNVIITDMRDVVFQSNPSDWLRDNLDSSSGKKLVVGTEAVRYCDEPWGNNNLMEAYGPCIHDLLKMNEIYNVGVIAGLAEYVKDLAFDIFLNSVNRPIQIVDQAVFNVMISHQPYKDITLFAKQSDGWACHIGALAVVDPALHLEPGPLYAPSEGEVWTRDGSRKFVIVHQYDRIQNWNLKCVRADA